MLQRLTSSLRQSETCFVVSKSSARHAYRQPNFLTPPSASLNFQNCVMDWVLTLSPTVTLDYWEGKLNSVLAASKADGTQRKV